MKLFKAWDVKKAQEMLMDKFKDFELKAEEIKIEESLNRILSNDIVSQIDVPHFRRSTVDGYAVITRDTYGASETMPVFLQVIDKVEMGKEIETSLTSDKAIYVPTGGMVPDGADSVVMVEYVESFDGENIGVYKTNAPKENIIDKGDDIKRGSIVLNKGMKIRPQDIGVLSSLGLERVKVFKRPRVTIISTGDEIVPPDMEAKPGQIKDINTYTISAMVKNCGGEVVHKQVVKDSFEELKRIMEASLNKSDMLILSGGSSVGEKDISAKVINDLGEPGVFVHGIAIKPGKPTILAKVKNKPVFGLPGQPASAMIVFKVFVEYFIRNLLFLDNEDYFIYGKSAVNIHSAQGKETYQMVTLHKDNDEYIASPVYGKSGMITLMSRAKGYIKIDTNKEGIKQGEEVKVYLF